jgi:hypothetical protein
MNHACQVSHTETQHAITTADFPVLQVIKLAQTVSELRLELEGKKRELAAVMQLAQAADGQAARLNGELRKATRWTAAAAAQLESLQKDNVELTVQTQTLTDEVADLEACHKADMQDVLLAHSRQRRQLERMVQLLLQELTLMRAQPRSDADSSVQAGGALALEDRVQTTIIEEIPAEDTGAPVAPDSHMEEGDSARGAAALIEVEAEDGDAALPAHAVASTEHDLAPTSAVPPPMPAADSAAETALDAPAQLPQAGGQLTAQADGVDASAEGAAASPPSGGTPDSSAARLPSATDVGLVTARTDAESTADDEQSPPRAASPQGGMLGAVIEAVERSDTLQWAITAALLTGVACCAPLAIGSLLMGRLCRRQLLYSSVERY